ncbi:hypothetical protein VTO42DRAFT_7204 [Malbranchea cinnamomea]
MASQPFDSRSSNSSFSFFPPRSSNHAPLQLQSTTARCQVTSTQHSNSSLHLSMHAQAQEKEQEQQLQHHQRQQPQQPQEQQQQQQPQYPQGQNHEQTAASDYPYHASYTASQTLSSGGPTATAPFLRDFNLVAEAAKRAEMAIMMRDLESVSLT